MTKRLLAGVVLLTVTLTSVLAADPPGAPADALAKSRETWKEWKDRCRGNYRYRVSFQSAFGFGHSTEIVVRDNKVTERSYAEFNRNAPPAAPQPGTAPPASPADKWSETGDELGRHKEGASPKTLDQLYDEAEKVVATKLAPEQRLFLAFDKQGLLQHCFYIDTRIADDGPRTGVAIDNLRLVLPND